jgi:hypothetical protein
LQYDAELLEASSTVASGNPTPPVDVVSMGIPAFQALFVRAWAPSDSQAPGVSPISEETHVTPVATIGCLPMSNCLDDSLGRTVQAPSPVPQLTVTDYGDNDAIVQSTTFVAEGRIGNNAVGGTFETDIGRSTSTPAQTGQFVWTRGSATNFTLQYTAPTRTAVFTLVGTPSSVLTYTVPTNAPAFDTLFVRTRAQSNSRALVNSLAFNGTSVALASDANCLIAGNCTGSLRDIIGISDFTPSSSFTLTGQVTFDWSGAVPSGSQLTFQLIAGTAVPEPSTSAVFGLLALGALSRAGRSTRRGA